MSTHPGRSVRIAPSILSADFSRLGEEIRAIDLAGADYIHVDVMDGHFVPNMTIGPCVVKSIRSATEKTFDVHLMISPVAPYIEAFAQAGADIISFHPQAEDDPKKTIELIKAQGVKVGLALNPDTDADVVDEFIDDLDLILVMTVNPGFGGQSFMPLMDKITAIREKIDQTGREIDLEVDGGINPETAAQVVEAGADLLVAGTAVFKGGAEHYAANIEELRTNRV